MSAGVQQMTWVVVDPKYAMDSNTKVVRIDVPYFPDEIDYEKIIGSAFEGDEYGEWRRQGGSLLLATPPSYEKLEQLMGGGWGDIPESAMANEVRSLCLERQAVVLKWMMTQ